MILSRHALIFLLSVFSAFVGCSGEPSRTPGRVEDQPAPEPVEAVSTPESHPKEVAPAARPPVDETPLPPKTPAEYSLSVEPTLQPDGDVRLDIASNIPGVIEVMADISLQGQAGDDVWVGKNERVRLSSGAGTVTLSTADLPEGNYDAEVSFYLDGAFKTLHHEPPASRRS